MGVYSNFEIRSALEQGHIVCHPLVPENIRKSSIDLTLGEWFFWAGKPKSGLYNPFDEHEVARFFEGPHRALPMSHWQMKSWYGKRELSGIPVDHPVIWMPPRARILAHTHEFVGIHPPGTTEMRARSSWGRNGISVCLCAGWGDPGYINRWTMEVHNLNDSAVPLPIGERIAQLIFHHTGPVEGGTYGDEDGYESKYQESSELAEVVAAWKPEHMLPRSWKDKRKMPLPIDLPQVVAP